MNQAQEQLLTFIRTKFITPGQDQAVDLSVNYDLLISGLVDSHGVLRIANFMEKTFQIKVPPRDIIIENFRSVDAMTQYLEKRLV